MTIDEPKWFIVRTNCEYSIIIEADNEELAKDKAATIPYE
jgi:predicted RNase H-related nuclease YkuK (DUF458 family)